MPRIRTIKAEFWTDSTMVLLPYPVRLFYIGLWNFADDYGWLVDEPFRLKMQIFPGDPTFEVDSAIDLLIAAGRLNRFEDDDGNPYLKVVHWEHQRVDHPGKGVLDGIDQVRPIPMSDEDRRAVAEKWDCPAILKIRRAPSRILASPRAGGERSGKEEEREEETEMKDALPAQLTDEQQEVANRFHSILVNTAGYEGSRLFLAKVVTKYAELDLEEEAMKIAAHAKGHRGWYSETHVFNWLAQDLEKLHEPKPTRSRGGGRPQQPRRLDGRAMGAPNPNGMTKEEIAGPYAHLVKG